MEGRGHERVEGSIPGISEYAMAKSDMKESTRLKSKSDNACRILLTLVILVILVIFSALGIFFYLV